MCNCRLFKFKDDGCIHGCARLKVDFFHIISRSRSRLPLFLVAISMEYLRCNFKTASSRLQVSAGLNVPSLYDSACHCVLNYLALIFPSLLGLINCVVCLPSITAWRGSTESPQSDGCTFWGTCCKCQQNITLSVLVSLCFHTSVLYEDIYVLDPVHNKRFTWAWWP